MLPTPYSQYADKAREAAEKVGKNVGAKVAEDDEAVNIIDF
ncbi:MAG: hypothetical protein ACI9G9_000957 [Psychromonas sp.]|jgi:hypothetical protein